MGVCVVFKGEAPGTGEIGHLAVYFFFNSDSQYPQKSGSLRVLPVVGGGDRDPWSKLAS